MILMNISHHYCLILLFYKTRIIIPSIFWQTTTVLIYAAIILSVVLKALDLDTSYVEYIFIGVVYLLGLRYSNTSAMGLKNLKISSTG